MQFTRAVKFGESPTTQQQEEGIKRPVQAFAENVLIHIPGEASGFYLLSAPLLGDSPSVRGLYVLFFLSLILLLVVRLLAKSSWAMILTTIVAFMIWMAVIDQGVFKVAYPDLLGPWGIVLAGFYSTLIGLFAAAGKLR